MSELEATSSAPGKADPELRSEILRLFQPGELDKTPGSWRKPHQKAWILLRLLEEGDREDLRWIFTLLEENEARTLLTSLGARRLSRRSLAFWNLVFGIDAVRGDREENPLWPL